MFMGRLLCPKNRAEPCIPTVPTPSICCSRETHLTLVPVMDTGGKKDPEGQMGSEAKWGAAQSRRGGPRSGEGRGFLEGVTCENREAASGRRKKAQGRFGGGGHAGRSGEVGPARTPPPLLPRCPRHSCHPGHGPSPGTENCLFLRGNRPTSPTRLAQPPWALERPRDSALANRRSADAALGGVRQGKRRGLSPCPLPRDRRESAGRQPFCGARTPP